jgi:hypothetical protein
MRIGMTLFALAAASTACGIERDSSPSSQVSWRIIDSSWVAPWDEMVDSAAVYRVAVVGPSHTDTLTDVLPPWPVIVGDSVVWGFKKIDDQSDRELFRWSIPTKRMRTLALPTDILGGYNDVMISPGARFLSYVAKEDTGGAYGVVRTLESQQLLWRGPTAAGCDCDIDLSHARWVTRDSFEIAVVSSSNGRGWAVSSGSVAARRAHLFYSPTEPDWHSSPRP